MHTDNSQSQGWMEFRLIQHVESTDSSPTLPVIADAGEAAGGGGAACWPAYYEIRHDLSPVSLETWTTTSAKRPPCVHFV